MTTLTIENLLDTTPATQITAPSVDDWRDHAACAVRVGPEMWDELTDRSLGATDVDITYAKRVCATCPLSDACLRAALAAEGRGGAHRRFGVWGGLDGIERAALAELEEKAERPREDNHDTGK